MKINLVFLPKEFMEEICKELRRYNLGMYDVCYVKNEIFLSALNLDRDMDISFHVKEMTFKKSAHADYKYVKLINAIVREKKKKWGIE